VVHTSPNQYVAWRFQTEVLAALGKHWDRAAKGRSGATAAQLARAWLRAERARPTCRALRAGSAVVSIAASGTR
jgi:hypothetical protein